MIGNKTSCEFTLNENFASNACVINEHVGRAAVGLLSSESMALQPVIHASRRSLQIIFVVMIGIQI